MNNCPIIKDEELLPYPKNVIQQAIVVYQEMYKNTFEFSKILPNYSKDRETLLECIVKGQMLLSGFQKIDPEDKDIVKAVNCYRTAGELPEKLQKQWIKLNFKYIPRDPMFNHRSNIKFHDKK